MSFSWSWLSKKKIGVWWKRKLFTESQFSIQMFLRQFLLTTTDENCYLAFIWQWRGGRYYAHPCIYLEGVKFRSFPIFIYYLPHVILHNWHGAEAWEIIACHGLSWTQDIAASPKLHLGQCTAHPWAHSQWRYVWICSIHFGVRTKQSSLTSELLEGHLFKGLTYSSIKVSSAEVQLH